MEATSLTDAIFEIFQEIQSCISNGKSFKLVASKSKSKEYKQWIFSPYKNHSDDTVQIKLIKRTTTQDFTSHFDLNQLSDELLSALNDQFYFADYYGCGSDLFLKQSKKGKVTLVKKLSNTSQIEIEEHNRKKQYLIQPDEPFLKALGVAGSGGKILSGYQRKFRQINKFIEIIDGLINDHNVLNIADMGCGKGYLTFALYVHLTRKYPGKDIQLCGYDIRPELVENCNQIASEFGYKGLTFKQGNIGEIETGPLDLLIALHACDIATDMAIQQGIKSKASFIVLSPCCHKQIRKAIKKKSLITQFGIYEERTAEMITDTIRALLLENHGYSVDIFEFISSEHTAKNTMITAKPGSKRVDAIEKIEFLKSMYGIDQHYLETLLNQNSLK